MMSTNAGEVPGGHCGIVAHDGRIISGGEFNVNRRESEINKTLRKM